MTKKKDNKDWKAIEKIVGVLEKFITDNYQVDHNVELPITGNSKGRTRQVDVLITVTNGGKRTRFMVEVQKRNTKVDINTFNGWMEKMKSVDCQHLICVSTKGFPKSVIEDVQDKYGTDTVTLMTLNDFDSLIDPETKVNIDFDFDSFKWAFDNTRWDIIDGSTPVLEEASKDLGSSFIKEIKDVIFEYQGNNYKVVEFYELLVRATTSQPEIRDNIRTGEDFKFKFKLREKDNLFYLDGERKLQVVKWDFTIKINMTPAQFKTETKKYAYRQEIKDNTLAWICSNTFEYERNLHNGQKPDQGIVQIDFICKLVNGKMQWKIEDRVIKTIKSE